jgi:A-kinase anchor protein 13
MLQEQVRAEQSDVTQQREQLYRKLEMLTSQGILISPNLPMVTGTLPHEEREIHISQSTDDSSPSTGGESTVSSPTATVDPRRKSETKWKSGSSKSTLPLNLISATTQQKVATNVQVKQQLPLKLATKLSCSASGGMQQMLPLKLSQGSDSRRSSGSGSGYQRLGSSHTRTGSSPAMMQNSDMGSSGTEGAARTNTYPKVPDRSHIHSPDSHPHTPSGPTPALQASEDEVIFF